MRTIPSTRTAPRPHLIVRRLALLFRITGSALALAGAIWLIRQGLFVTHAGRVPGVVVSVGKLDDDSSARTVTFRFTNAQGVAHIGSSTYFSLATCPAVKAGDTVLILVDHASKRVEIDAFQTLWSCPIFIVSLGFLFALGGYLLSLTAPGRFTGGLS